MDENNDLELNIELNADQAEEGTKKLIAFEKAWLHLASLPTIDFSQKFKHRTISIGQNNPSVLAGLGMSAGIGQTGSAEAHRAAINNLKKEESNVKELSYTWDSLYKKELDLIKNKDKKQKFLGMMDKEAFKGMMQAPASSTGTYHPAKMNLPGGLVQHSRAVAQGALGLAALYDIKTNEDDLILQSLGHDMHKQNAAGFLNKKHAETGAEAFERYDLKGNAVKTHMGMFKGGSKTAERAVTDEERLLKESDWLASRKYAGDFMTFDKDNKLLGVDSAGLRQAAIDKGDAVQDKNSKFLKVVNEEEDKKAKAAKKYENSWHSAEQSAGRMFQVLKKIAALGLGALYIGMKETAEGSATMSGGLGMFTGTTNKQTLDNELREKKASLGKGSINAAIIKLSEQRGAFQTTGEGDLLWKAFGKNIEGLMTGNQPMQEVYAEAADELTRQLSGTKTQGEKDKLLARIGKTFGPEMQRVVNTQASLGENYSQLGDRTAPDEGYLNWSKSVMETNAQMQTSINGIKDTWKGLFTTFQSMFGNPFLKWLDVTFRSLGLNVYADFKGQEALGTYMQMIEANKDIKSGDLEGEYDKERAAAVKAFKKSERYRALDTAQNPFAFSMDGPGRLERLKAARALGADLPDNATAAQIQNAVQALMASELTGAENAAGGKYNNSSMLGIGKRRAKAYSAFLLNNPGMFKEYPELLDPSKGFGKFELPITEGMNIYEGDRSAANKAAMESIFKSFEEAQKHEKDAGKVSSAGGAVTVTMNFPGVTSAAEITKAAGSVPQALKDGYAGLYVERG